MKKTTPEESESIELTENQSEDKTIHQKRLDRQSQQQVKPATAYSLLSVLAVVLVIVVFVLPRFVAENEVNISDEGVEDGNTEVLLNEAVLAQKPIAEALLSEMLSKMDDPLSPVMSVFDGSKRRVLLCQTHSCVSQNRCMIYDT